MSWVEMDCPKCGVRLKTRVRGIGVPGGKERENGFCPICRELVISEVTDGFVDVELNSSGGSTITNALTGEAHEKTPDGLSLKGVTFSNREAADKFTAIYWRNAVMTVCVPVKE